MEKQKVGYVKKLKNGKYFLRLSFGFDEFGRRIQPSQTVKAKSDREAEKLLMDFYGEHEKLKNRQKAKGPLTLSELYDEWIKHHVESDLRESTQNFYKGLWEKHLSVYGKSKLKTFSPKMVRDILSGFESSSRLRKGIYGMLNAMFSKATKWEYMVENPCNKVDVPKYKAPEKKPYTDEELIFILQTISDVELCFQAIFYFAVVCGLRRGEIVGLKWEDINFEANYFDVCRSTSNKKGEGTVPGDTKNFSSQRRLELPGILVPILKGIRAEQNEKKLKLGDHWIDEGWVFTRWNGQIMGQNRPDRWLAKMREKYPKWPRKDLHTLRHTAITDMILDGVPLSIVSKTGGHAQQSTTLNIYSHVINRVQKQGVQAQEDHINGLKEKSVQKSVQ